MTTKLTLKTAKARLRLLNMTLNRNAETGEYRVNLAGGSESTAYYTNDLDDAFATAIVIYNHTRSYERH